MLLFYDCLLPRHVRREWQQFWKGLSVSWIADGTLWWPRRVTVQPAT